MDAGIVITFGENDVPGAKFLHKTPEEHTNIQLKRWLKCRGLNSSGNRSEIIERCVNAAKCNVEVDPSIDGGKWYDLKVHEARNARSQSVKPSAPILPISGWKKFPSTNIPKFFNDGHIYYFLVESVSALGGAEGSSESDSPDDVHTSPDDVHTSKPFTKGKTLFASGHVKCMQDSSKNNFYFLKASVQASYSNKVYNTTVTMSSTSGTITEGTCTCVGSGMGRCAHVAALLFALNDYISQFGTDVLTCTEKLCGWNTGRKRNKCPKPVFKGSYPSIKKELKKNKNTGNVINSDPRPQNLRTNTITTEEKNNFISDVQLSCGTCGWTNILDIDYSDFSLEEYGKEDLKAQCLTFSKNLEDACKGRDVPFCVPGTENQDSNGAWHINRRCRITASSAKDISCVKSGFCGLLKRQLWGDGISTTALQYGKDCENLAFNSYMDKKMSSSVQKTGLWINPKWPQLACSPDGLVEDISTCEEGVLEIKCPFILKHCNPLDAENNLTKKQTNNFCCEVLPNKTLRLKRNHKYYYQIQMQMGICERTYCDFVVWSKHGMAVERIPFDPVFWNNLVPKLLKFHREYLIPEFFTMRIPRELAPIPFQY